jgi:hypothetical protein
MAATAGNGPLVPHLLSKIQVHCIWLIGNDAPSKLISILPATSRYKAHKILWWCGDDDMNLAAPSECFGVYTGSSPVKCIFAWSGHHTRSIRRDVLEFLTTYEALGGHFRRRRPWCRGAVGRWSLVLRHHKSYIELGIVWNKFILV